MNNNRIATALVGAALVATSLGLAGCSAPAAPSSATASATPTTTASPNAKPGAGVISGTKTTTCDTTPGSVTATGTVTLPEAKKGDVKVSISWVSRDTNSVQARAETTLRDLQPGKQADWKVTSTLPADAANITCVTGATLVD